MQTLSNISLYHGDCMEIMKSFPDRYFQLAITDPPYFSGPEKRAYYGSEVSTTKVRRKYYPVTERWEVPGEEYFKELQRVSEHYIVWGCNYYNHIFHPGRIIWDKCNGESTFSDCEIAATDLISSVRLFAYMWNGMLQGKSITEGRTMQGNKRKNEIRIHPTQKPVALYGWLLNNFARQGWRILDTHLGSGSLAIACHDLGFEMHGIEIDSYYFKAACDRLRNHQRQLKLF